jgi:8-oxo-dGTP pyrophosphatase MutT (NUDIX family)
MNESIAFQGKIGEIVHTTQKDGRIFERYRRAPGTRLIIISPDNKILVTKEYRHETGSVDLRLPGGKVRDTIEEYHELLESSKDIAEAARETAVKEALEETGLTVHDPKFLVKANSGATVEWDLYYFLVTKYDEHPDGQQLEHGEDIEVAWATVEELKEAITNGHMNEWRSVGVFLGLVLPKLAQ